jgi:selenocysteine-specific elongation factor
MPELANAKVATRFFTIATAGHVDHGKTSLLRKLTGIDPDRLKEEKERQMTTDLGFAYLPLGENLVVGFVDVPGHGKFLKNMLAGVGGIDLALLIVAADEGPMPQTKQHVRILSLLGVRRAIVAITKIDLVQEKEQIDLVIDEAKSMLEAHGIEALAFCPLASTTGEGFDNLRAAFSKVLSAMPARDTSASLLLPVDRVFSKAGFGTVITGTLVNGKLTVGDQIFIEPGDISARVRRLETHGQQVNEAMPGQRVACNLVIKEGEKLKRGFVLAGEAISPTKAMIVSLFDRPRILTQPLSDRLSDQPIRLYHGTAEYQGFIRWVEDRKLEAEQANQQDGFGFVALQDDGVLSAGDRFVIRLTDDTIYGGVILLRERPRWLSKGEILQLATLLDEEKHEEALHRFLDDSPQLMLKEAQLSAIHPELVRQKLVADGIASGNLLRLGDNLITKNSRNELSKKISQTIKQMLESSEEASEGVGLEALRLKLQPKLERTAFQALIEEESAQSRIVKKGDKIALPGAPAQKAASPLHADAEAKLLKTLQEHWCLELDELSQTANVELKLCKQIVQNLTKNGTLIIASYDFIASKEKINEAHQVLADLWNAKRNITPTDFKEKIGVTRKYAMALLQYFDDAKITRRLDSGRVLLKGPGRV